MTIHAKNDQEFLEKLEKELKQRDRFCFSTCDCSSYGWCENAHRAMMRLYRYGLEGFIISYQYNYEVYDWTIEHAEDVITKKVSFGSG